MHGCSRPVRRLCGLQAAAEEEFAIAGQERISDRGFIMGSRQESVIVMLTLFSCRNDGMA